MSNKYVDSAGLGEYTKKVKSAIGVAMSDSVPKKDIEDAAIASFNDGAENVPVNALTVGIESQQDLHGQASPYPPNGGKNKFVMTVAGIKAANSGATWSGNSCVLNGVTFTILTDAANNVIGVSASGTASGNAVLSFDSFTVAAGDYILSGCPSGGDYATKYRLLLSGVTSDIGSSASVTVSEATATFGQIYVYSGYAISGTLIFTPMLRLSTEADATFAPYSNICPIYSQAEKNLLIPTGESTSFAGITVVKESDGTYNVSGTASALVVVKAGTIFVQNGKSYTLNGCYMGGSTTSYRLDLRSDASTVYNNVIDYGNGISFTAGADATLDVYIRIYAGYVIDGTLVFKPMIRDAANPDSRFVPHRCAASIEVEGENLLDITQVKQGTISGDFGEVINSTTRISSGLIPIRGGEGYAIKSFGDALLFERAYFDKSKVYSGRLYTMNTSTFSETAPEDAAYIRFSMRYSDNSTIVPSTASEVMAVYGTTLPTELVASTGRTYFSLAKDVWDQEWELGTYNSSGEKAADNSKIRSVNASAILPSTRYYVVNEGETGDSNYLNIRYYDAQGNYISGASPYGGQTFVTPENARYLRFSLNSAYGTTYKNNIAILNAPPEIYGGELNVTTGELKVTYGRQNLGSLTWNKSGTDGTFYVNSANSWIKFPATEYVAFNGLCDSYKVDSYENGHSAFGTIYTSWASAGSKLLYIRDSAYADADAATFKTAMVGKYLVYEAVNQPVFHLDPVQVKTWLKENNITANTGDIIKLRYAVDPAMALDEAVSAKVPDAPSEDGSYQLIVTVTDGVPVYSWEAAE